MHDAHRPLDGGANDAAGAVMKCGACRGCKSGGVCDYVAFRITADGRVCRPTRPGQVVPAPAPAGRAGFTPLDRLFDATTYAAAVVGRVDQGLSLAGVTDAPWRAGFAVLQQGVNAGLELLVNAGPSIASAIAALSGSFDYKGLASSLLTFILGIDDAILRAGAKTSANFGRARCTYLAGFQGITWTGLLPGIGCEHTGGYRFVRAALGLDALAKDRCVPYSDPLGTVPQQYTDWVNGQVGGQLQPETALDGTPTPHLRPYGMKLAEDGWMWPDECTNYFILLLDIAGQDCTWTDTLPNGRDRRTVCWPWAWPLTAPLRVQGAWGKHADIHAEKAVAALYAVPSPQHIVTRWSDFQESQRYIRAAMRLHYPEARQLGPGYWVLPEDARDAWVGPRPAFLDYRDAMARLYNFAACRATLLNAPRAALPPELRALMVGDDWGP